MKISCKNASIQLWARLSAHPLMRIYPLVAHGVKKLSNGNEAIYLVVSSRNALQIVPDDFRGYDVITRVTEEKDQEKQETEPL